MDNSKANPFTSQTEITDNGSPVDSTSPRVRDESFGVVDSEGQTLISCPSLVVKSFSFDTFHIYFHMRMDNMFFLEELSSVKASLQQGVDTEIAYDFGFGSHFKWNLQRTGIKYFPFVFRTGDLILGLSLRGADSTIPNVSLMVGSMSSSQDVLLLLHKFKRWLQLMEMEVIEEKVSRFDICSDITCNFDKSEVYDFRKFITRARDINIFTSHRNYTGVQIGSGDIVCRMYDKQVEMEQKRDIEKQMFFNELWGTKKEDDILRIEFQLRRGAVTQFFTESSTVEDIVNKSCELWDYLTKKWLRQAESVIDRKNKNQSKSEISIFWEAVQSASGFVRTKIVRIKKPKCINIPDLRRQASGILMSVAAGLGQDFKDYFGIMSTISDIISNDIDELLTDPSYQSKFETKQIRAMATF